MSTKPKGLGKDFSALIPEDMLSEALAVNTSTKSIDEINLAELQPDPDQPRKYFSDEALSELADSIKEHGILQPLVVAKKGSGYVIIAGERRYRAAKLANLSTVPAIVRSYSEQQKLEVSLIENVQREDLTVMEQATAYVVLHDQFNLTFEEIAKHVGRNTKTVINFSRMLSLPEAAKEALNKELIFEGHGRQILAIKDREEQLKLLKLILKNRWTVRQAEQYVIGYKRQVAQDNEPDKALRLTKSESPETMKLASRLKTEVHVKHMAKGGRLLIYFKDESHLDSLINELLG